MSTVRETLVFKIREKIAQCDQVLAQFHRALEDTGVHHTIAWQGEKAIQASHFLTCLQQVLSLVQRSEDLKSDLAAERKYLQDQILGRALGSWHPGQLPTLVNFDALLRCSATRQALKLVEELQDSLDILEGDTP